MIKKALSQTRLISIAAFLQMLYTSSAIAMMGGGMGGSSTSHMDNNTQHMTIRQMDQCQQQMHNEYMDEYMSDQQMLDSQHLNDQDMNHDVIDHDKMDHNKMDHESNQKMAEDFFQE